MTQTERVVEAMNYCERQAAVYSQMACDGSRVELNAARADVWKTTASLLANVLEERV